MTFKHTADSDIYISVPYRCCVQYYNSLYDLICGYLKHLWLPAVNP